MKKEDTFEKEPYKSMIYLLTIFPDGLKPRDLLSTLATEKRMKELQNKKTIQYEFKRYKREIIEKLDRKRIEIKEFNNHISIGCLTSPSQLSNRLKDMEDLKIIYKSKNEKSGRETWKLNNEIVRHNNILLYQERIASYSTSTSRNIDRQKLKETKEKILESHSVLLSVFNKEEKVYFYNCLEEMYQSIEKINNFVISKMLYKLEDILKNIIRQTNNHKIKKAIEESSHHFFMLIYFPYFIIEIYEQKKFTKEDFYLSTGIFFIVCYLVNLNYKNKYLEKIDNDIDYRVITKKDFSALVNGKNFLDKTADFLEKRDFKNLCIFWSETFFWKDYDFNIDDIFEIVYLLSMKLEEFKELYKNYFNLLPQDAIGYINMMYLALKKENIPYKILLFNK
jgi:DNA-binding HxlR family transcriptional regulator